MKIAEIAEERGLDLVQLFQVAIFETVCKLYKSDKQAKFIALNYLYDRQVNSKVADCCDFTIYFKLRKSLCKEQVKNQKAIESFIA